MPAAGCGFRAPGWGLGHGVVRDGVKVSMNGGDGRRNDMIRKTVVWGLVVPFGAGSCIAFLVLPLFPYWTVLCGAAALGAGLGLLGRRVAESAVPAIKNFKVSLRRSTGFPIFSVLVLAGVGVGLWFMPEASCGGPVGKRLLLAVYADLVFIRALLAGIEADGASRPR